MWRKGNALMKKNIVSQFVATSLLLAMTACSSETEEHSVELLPDQGSQVVDFLDDETEDKFNDDLNEDTIISSKVNAPVDFKDWISNVELSSVVMKKDGYSLQLPQDLVVYQCDSENRVTLSQNIPIETEVYHSPQTLEHHYITIVRGDAGILETKEMVYKQQIELEKLAQEEHIAVEELVFIHDFKEFDNKYGEVFQYTMIETMNYSEEFPTSLILILAQEQGHLYFDASYETDQQKQELKTYLLELCYHISPDGDGFLSNESDGEATFYQLQLDGTEIKIELDSGQTPSPIQIG